MLLVSKKLIDEKDLVLDIEKRSSFTNYIQLAQSWVAETQFSGYSDRKEYLFVFLRVKTWNIPNCIWTEE